MVEVKAPCLTQPMDPEKISLNFIFPTKYVIPKSLKFSHWPSKLFFGGDMTRTSSKKLGPIGIKSMGSSR